MLRRTPIYPFFFFNDTATTEIYTLSLHDALPIWYCCSELAIQFDGRCKEVPIRSIHSNRSEEHTSELQSLRHLVCRLLLEKKKKQETNQNTGTMSTQWRKYESTEVSC